jgi:hypothetical protein
MRANHWRCPVALGSLLLLAGVDPAMAQRRSVPAAPASQPQTYDADVGTCTTAGMREAFERQLAPFSDQSPAVLARLAQVQAERTLASLRRCVQRGLIPEAEAVDLAVELGLIEANPAAVQPSAVPTRP